MKDSDPEPWNDAVTDVAATFRLGSESSLFNKSNVPDVRINFDLASSRTLLQLLEAHPVGFKCKNTARVTTITNAAIKITSPPCDDCRLT
jgi:hypothetical protein